MQKSHIIAPCAILVLLFGLLFYWYEYRPTDIRKTCFKISRGLDFSAFGKEVADSEYDQRYNDCLKSYGL